MAFIPRQVKPPARMPITCKVPEQPTVRDSDNEDWVAEARAVRELLGVLFNIRKPATQLERDRARKLLIVILVDLPHRKP